MAGIKSHIIAVLCLFALSGCALFSASKAKLIDDDASVLGRDLGRRAAMGESVDAKGVLRGAAIRLGLDEVGRRRFAEIFWEQYQRGYYGAGPYRMTPGGGGL